MNQLPMMLAALGTVASIGYCGVAIWAAIRFRRAQVSRTPLPQTLPPVSILKSLKGIDPQMHESLRSHCVQTYPEYEILFGVSDLNDPAVAIVEGLRHEFPDRKIRLVHCEKNLGANRKVSNLAQMARAANYDLLLINDSDIRVDADYLTTVIRELQQPNVGMVTCLYRGISGPTVASRFESLGIGTDFAAGVLVARELERGLRFGLGSTMALRKSDLRAIGGFEAIADYLADDYELGKRIANRNLKVTLSKHIVDSFLPEYDFSQFFSHQLRWARTIRASRPAGYAGLLMTFTLPWALVNLAAARGASWAIGLLSVALLARASMALAVGKLALNDQQVLRSMWLLPLRDVLAIVVWVVGLAGRKIAWRGESFQVNKGKLERIS
jgi:ceramide glucosyltransferase